MTVLASMDSNGPLSQCARNKHQKVPNNRGQAAATSPSMAMHARPHSHRRSSRRSLTPVMLLLTIILSATSRAAVSAESDGYTILSLLYEATDGPNWSESTNWNSLSVDICDWHGITCGDGGAAPGGGNDAAAITRIVLNDNNLQGAIPSQLWTLPSLTEVSFRNNGITSLGLGDVTPDTAPLQSLFMASNHLTEIDPNIAIFAPTLTHVNFNKNLLDAPLPEELFQLSRLQSLYVAFNQIPGSLPTEIGKLPDITELFAFENKFSGALPTELGLLVACQILGLGNNDFTGTLPTEMNAMVNLRDVSIHHTTLADAGDDINNDGDATPPTRGLTGPLLNFGDMPYLALLFLDGNSLTGSIPSDFLRHNQNLEEPLSLGLADNRLSGTVPSSLKRFGFLSIDLVGNMITEIPTELCDITGWMGGLVESYQCDAILCRQGTYQETEGRSVRDDALCQTCPGSTNPILGATSCDTAPAIEQPAWKLLAEFYQNLNGKQWVSQDGWEIFSNVSDEGLSDEQIEALNIDFCAGWYGVICDMDKDIIDLSLPKNGLYGTIPHSIFTLPKLKNFDVSSNDVVLQDFKPVAQASDTLQELVLSHSKVQSLDGIGALQNVRILYLDGLNMELPIPEELFELTNLKILHLQHGRFGSSLPTSIGQLSHLELLNVYGNSFTGSLPSEIGLLVKAESLDFSENQFEGRLPDALTNLSVLRSFSIHQEDGQLNGPLPSFKEFPQLHDLNLDRNQFTGSIPTDFLGQIADKSVSTRVSLAHNRLEGAIPASLDDFLRLTLNLEDNQITSIPSVLCENDDWMKGEVGSVGLIDASARCNAILCPPLTWSESGKATSIGNGLDCQPCPANSNLFGQTACGQDEVNLERQILDKLFTATGGRYWNVTHENWMNPGVPICQREGVACTGDDNDNFGVDRLSLFDFGLRGTIPSEIWQLPQARSFGFTGNHAVDISFVGIENAPKIIDFKFSKCQLRSLDGLGNAPSSLREVHLAENGLDGPIPSHIFQLTNIGKLFLNNNHFTGTIPTEVGRFSTMRELHLHSNRLIGIIPSNIGQIETLAKLDLSDNKLSGGIPEELENLQYLSQLLLARQASNQKLYGPLLPFANNEDLMRVDVSGNRLSGPLPPSFVAGVEPTQQITLDLSSNAFTGTIPEQWKRMDRLELNIANNWITGLPDVLCQQSGWNGEKVGLLGTCDAIACPPGTFAHDGRIVTVNQVCEPCDGGAAGAPYFGSTKCQDPALLAELDILRNFYTATDGASWLTQTHWMSDRPPCSWHGIVCDDAGFIEEISIENNFIKGASSGDDDLSGILKLSKLQVLDLKGNEITLDLNQIVDNSKIEFLRLSGTGMTTLEGVSRASQLKALHVTNNEIEDIPSEIFLLNKLESLFLSFNSIEGPISARFSELKSLRELYAFGNYFTGSIPRTLGTLSELTELVLSLNGLSGEIPNELGSLPKLEQLSLYDQEGAELITGPLPSFSSAPNLWYLDVSDNDLTGPIPDNFLANSVYTDETLSIYLHNNELTGTIPSSLDRFESLDLNAAGNKIEEIPPSLCELGGWLNGNVQKVGNCSGILCPRGTFNQFGYQSPGNPCTSCSHLADVTFLGQRHCENFTSEGVTLDALFDATGGEFWTGNDGWKSDLPICSWQGVLCGNGDLQDTSGITSIMLDNNGLVGTLPSEIWTLPFLQTVSLKGNPELVVTFDGLSKAADSLEVLYVSEVRLNSLSGISQATSLRDLHITGNDIKGTFPEELFALSDSLETLYIAYNLFYGHIPTRIGEMTKLQALYAFDNDFITTIPTEIGLLNDLRVLVLSENIVYGQIPTELSSMPNLDVLSVYREQKSGPRLTGSLPPLDRLPQLKYLFLHGNELRGSIPDNFLAGSLALEEIHLASNFLTGTVPFSFNDQEILYLSLEDNRLTDLPDEYCSKDLWMDGAVELYGCSAIMCSPGSANSRGRSVGVAGTAGMCQECDVPSNAAYYGSITCDAPPNDKTILMNLYSDLNGDKWRRSDYWNTNADVCDWYGVACIEGDIVEINLGSNNLKGLPGPDLFDLPQLRILWLNSNPITFSFENIGSAKKLEDIRLDGTNVHSVHGIGAGIPLVNIDVGYTSIRGAFPKEILELSNLRTLSMRGNDLTGPLPPSLAKLRFLVSIQVNANKLDGSLPPFDDMRFLSNIQLQGNAFTGAIPKKFLDKMAADDTIFANLANNQLTGVVPEDLSRFPSLTLHLRNNQILGLPLNLCDQDGWHDGDVGQFGCDGIMCKPGTANQFGRQTDNTPCIECPSARYYGSTNCSNNSSSSGTSVLSTLPAMALMIVAAIQIVL